MTLRLLNNSPRYALAIAAFLSSASAFAENQSMTNSKDDAIVVTTGQAYVVEGDTEAAQMRALLDALRSAATERAGRLTSHSSVDADGQLTENVSLIADINISKMDILEQRLTSGLAQVKVAVTLEQDGTNCAQPSLTPVITTDLAAPQTQHYVSQIDINQLLIEAEQEFSVNAAQHQFKTYRINSALNTYETAWLASEAYNQADYHLTIGAQWHVASANNTQSLSFFKTLLPNSSNTGDVLQLTANFFSPNSAIASFSLEQGFNLPAKRSISASVDPIPKELSKQVEQWTAHLWQQVQERTACLGSFVTISNIIDQPLWRMNKGGKLGLQAGQQVLVLPKNYQQGILNPDTNHAPVVLKVQKLEPHSALLEYLAGPKDFPTGPAQIFIF